MSQFILDDQIDATEVLRPLAEGGIRCRRLRDLRPGERILDDRVPELLRELAQPTFLTIDPGFWDRRHCHPGYGIRFFDVRDDQQELIPDLLRALLRRPEFRSRAARMGKVARVHPAAIEFWQFKEAEVRRVDWTGPTS